MNFINADSPNSLKQRAYNETGMIELITYLVNEINKKGDILKERKGSGSEYKKIRTIYSLGYELLQSIAANN